MGSICILKVLNSLYPLCSDHHMCPRISYFSSERLKKSIFPPLQDLGGVHIYFPRNAFIIVIASEWIPEWRWVCCCPWLAASLPMNSMAMFNSIKPAFSIVCPLRVFKNPLSSPSQIPSREQALPTMAVWGVLDLSQLGLLDLCPFHSSLLSIPKTRLREV